MLAIYLATALTRTPWILGAIGLVFVVVGTEMRVRIEDGLLASRFGREFEDYRSSTPAYLPFLR
jgi:protein-S-isoprenylcysteine O-methyltransferase Ste14